MMYLEGGTIADGKLMIASVFCGMKRKIVKIISEIMSCSRIRIPIEIWSVEQQSRQDGTAE